MRGVQKSNTVVKIKTASKNEKIYFRSLLIERYHFRSSQYASKKFASKNTMFATICFDLQVLPHTFLDLDSIWYEIYFVGPACASSLCGFFTGTSACIPNSRKSCSTARNQQQEPDRKQQDSGTDNQHCHIWWTNARFSLERIGFCNDNNSARRIYQEHDAFQRQLQLQSLQKATANGHPSGAHARSTSE